MARGPIKKDSNKEVLRSFINFRRSEQPLPTVDLQPGDIMLNSTYIKQSSTLISDALQKGFDVLQMANGDIVTTGTKTVVYKYTWDEETGKLKRSNVSSKKGNGDELEPEEDIVVEALADVE
jgi:hypothetical protein